MKTIHDLAKMVFDGESVSRGDYCLLPLYLAEMFSKEKWFDGGDDEVIEKYDATHFDVHWEEKGKTVLVTLYKGTGWGCADMVKQVHQEVISI